MKSKQQHIHGTKKDNTQTEPCKYSNRLTKKEIAPNGLQPVFRWSSLSVCVVAFFPPCITNCIYAFSILSNARSDVQFLFVIQCACETFSHWTMRQCQNEMHMQHVHTLTSTNYKEKNHSFHYHYYLHFNLTCIQHSTGLKLLSFFSLLQCRHIEKWRTDSTPNALYGAKSSIQSLNALQQMNCNIVRVWWKVIFCVCRLWHSIYRCIFRWVTSLMVHITFHSDSFFDYDGKSNGKVHFYIGRLRHKHLLWCELFFVLFCFVKSWWLLISEESGKVNFVQMTIINSIAFLAKWNRTFFKHTKQLTSLYDKTKNGDLKQDWDLWSVLIWHWLNYKVSPSWEKSDEWIWTVKHSECMNLYAKLNSVWKWSRSRSRSNNENWPGFRFWNRWNILYKVASHKHTVYRIW